MLFQVSAALVLAMVSLSASALPSIITDSSAEKAPRPTASSGYIDSPTDHKTTNYALGDKINFRYTPAPLTSYVNVKLMKANGSDSFVLANFLSGAKGELKYQVFARVPLNAADFPNDIVETSQVQSIDGPSKKCILTYLVAEEHQTGPGAIKGPIIKKQAIVIDM